MQKKKLLAMALTGMIVITTQTVPAAALSELPGGSQGVSIIAPRWVSTTKVVPSISNSGKTLSVSVYIAPKKSTEKSTGTLYLEQYSSGKWSTVTSWEINKTGTVDITKTYTGKSGGKYRTKAVVTTGVDKINVTSSEVTVK